ncbi:MAG TPA: YggS family pyridoxal phosphate-dependent enzyme [Deltaproteobacteria bacterium]|nr:YggS family pyridoxal phosphate-dependent enzyme [Deltaproteobacteria bacterium]
MTSPSSNPLSTIQTRIRAAAERAGRDPASVRLIGVSKGQSFEKILTLAAAGLRDFGENYVQEWLEKKSLLEKEHPDLATQLRWHFIGHLQSNKAAEVLGRAALVHSVDSLKLARKLSALAVQRNLIQPLLLEVLLAPEANKSGLTPELLRQSLKDFASLPGLEYRGLMALPPAVEEAEAARPFFRLLKSLLDECNETGFFAKPLTDLSMGMSQDFEIAVEEGATYVRVGTALFGPRT